MDITRINYEPMPIWFASEEKKGRCKISTPKLVEFLKSNGFGIMDDKYIHRQENGMLKNTSESEITKWIYKYFKKFDYEDFLNPDLLGVVKSIVKRTDEDEGGEVIVETNHQYFTKDEVIGTLMDNGWIKSNLSIYLNEFHEDKKSIIDEESEQNYTPLFRDDKDCVYTFFENGLVTTTKNGSSISDYDSNSIYGFIWESSINKNLDYYKLGSNENGLFERFVEKCMSYKNDKDEWVIDESEYESFRTSYGYMISNHTNGGDTPCVIYVDRDSDGKHAEGGNGKSLVLGSLKYWKPTVTLNGRDEKVRKGDSFVYENVTPETEFVFLDDVSSDFDFSQIFNACTGDVHIQRKHKSPIVIPSHRKPKYGIATNYILSDNDFSTKRRQVINEFGSFWHELRRLDEETPDVYLGKRLFDEFNSTDWNQFFQFGFRCIEEFLQKGLVQNNHSNYLKKQLIAQVEGDGVRDGIVEWIEGYIRKNEDVLFLNGKSLTDVYTDFDNEFDDEVIQKWDLPRFHKGIYKVCEWNKWFYNPHKSGKTMSDKRWLHGPRGNQGPWIRIQTKPVVKVV